MSWGRGNPSLRNSLRKEKTTALHYRNIIADWGAFSDLFKDKYGVRPDYEYYKSLAEQEERRSNSEHTEVWRDMTGKPVTVRFINGKAVTV